MLNKNVPASSISTNRPHHFKLSRYLVGQIQEKSNEQGDHFSKGPKKNYGQFEAVKGISFDVIEGEIFGLLGSNGAGKSTTLEIIETLREKTSGEVYVNGFNLDKDPNSIKQLIGVQLQTSGFYPGLNLVELIDLFAGLYNPAR